MDSPEQHARFSPEVGPETVAKLSIIFECTIHTDFVFLEPSIRWDGNWQTDLWKVLMSQAQKT